MKTDNQPSFTAPKLNHRLINRMVTMASSYDWQSDRSILVLRNVLNLRSRVRTRFLASISAVGACLAFHAQLTPVKAADGQRVLFAMPDYVYVSNIAAQCGISRYTVYRVLDYLAAIGDLITHTKFDPIAKEYSPTQIILTENFYIRIGFKFDELKAAVISVNKGQAKKETSQSNLKSKIGEFIKELRPSVKRRLTKSTEGILTNEIIQDEKSQVISIPKRNGLLDSFISKVKVNTGTTSSDYIKSEGYKGTQNPIANYSNNPEYLSLINALREEGVPIAKRHRLAVESLNKSS